MGTLRKLVSVSTAGVVNYRSTEEVYARAASMEARAYVKVAKAQARALRRGGNCE